MPRKRTLTDQERIEHRREAVRRSNAKHKEQRDEYQRRYVVEHRAEIRARRREYMREYQRRYRIEHRKECNEDARKRMQRWRDTHPERAREARTRGNQKWRKSHPEIIQEINRNTKARRKGAPRKHTQRDIAILYICQYGRCANAQCFADLRTGYHIDHIRAIKNGGSNWPENLQLLCPPCNLKKGAS